MERRLAAILAADVVGYSRLMGADEAGTLAALKAHRRSLIDPKIAEHNGRIVKLMGDGALVEFASVVDAVQCAVEIQRAMAARNEGVPDARRIAFRIGINLGDVIVEGDDIYGDGVNVAARLEGLAEPGGVCVSDIVHQSVKAKLDTVFEDLGPQSVKNIAEPVRAFRVALDGKATAPRARPAAKPGIKWRWVQSAAALVLSLLAVAGLVLWRPWAPDVTPASVERMAFRLPEKPSIAVLPFDNMSDDPGQDYFADGITEDLITDVSKISGLFVIARNSTFAYKGKSPDVRRIAEELGVRYVVEGSVRRAGSRVRINVQLIDATTGGHLWAERYDGSLEDVFALQDQVTRKIVAALAVRLTAGEEEQVARKYTDNPEAYDAFLQGRELYRRFTPEAFAAAVPHLQRAIALDPDYGRAYAALASLYWETLRQGEPWSMTVNPDAATSISLLASRNKAEMYLARAMKNPSPLAYRVASAISWDFRQFDDAIAEANQAVALDPNDPDGHVALAWAMIFGGQPGKALAAVERAMRLDPQNPEVYWYVLGMARLGLEDYEGAVAALQRARARSPEYRDVNIPLAAAYAHLGRDDEAQAALKRYTDAWRTFANDIDGVMGWWPFRREADVRRFGGELVRAGLCCAEKLDDYIARVRAGGTLE